MSASIIKYIGRTTDFKGKTLWEIVGNLKNHGVGRIVIRQMLQRYPEPTYMKIVKVEAVPNPTEVSRFLTDLTNQASSANTFILFMYSGRS